MNFWVYKIIPQIKKMRTKNTVKIFLTSLILFICFFGAGCNKKQKSVIIEKTEITAEQKKLKEYLFKNICSILNDKKIKNENYTNKLWKQKKIWNEKYYYCRTRRVLVAN